MRLSDQVDRQESKIDILQKEAITPTDKLAGMKNVNAENRVHKERIMTLETQLNRYRELELDYIFILGETDYKNRDNINS